MDCGKPIMAARLSERGNMGIKFTHITAENFCGQKEFETDLFDKTIIKGYNKVGKSTIRNMILWVLTDKLESNAAAGDSIRPHDTDGNRIDFVEIKVSLTIEVDGETFILTKIQKQKWVKKRGSEQQEFQGNENLYEVSGVPKSAKDFSEFISQNICNTDDLPFCINANAFLSLDAKKRRAKVLGLAKSISDAELAQSDERFSEIASDLKVGTIEELLKRSKTAIAGLKKTQGELPARIDEVSKQKVDYDFAELELEKNAIAEQLAEFEKEAQHKAQLEKDIARCEAELSSIEQKVNAVANAKRSQIQLDIADLKPNLITINGDIEKFSNQSAELVKTAENKRKELEKAKQQIKIVSSDVFDDSNLVCPNCKQEYPAEKQDELRKAFEENNANELSRLTEYVETLERDIKDAEQKAKACNERINEAYEAKRSTEKAVSMKEAELERVKDADVFSDAEYKAKLDEIERLKDEICKCTPAVEKAEIRQKMTEVEGRLAQADANNRLDDRIAELKEEQKNVGAKILKEERMLYLLEEFNREKIKRLESSVNQYFDIIKWFFFAPQINGGYQEVCRAMVDGESYDSLLNKSDRLLCQTDLVRGFQKASGIDIAVLVDDTESIDASRLPNYDGIQMIYFRREDCKLTVEEVK